MSYMVTPIFDVDEILNLDQEWKYLDKLAAERDYYLSYDWYYPLITGCSAVPKNPVVFVCRYKGMIEGLIPCYLEKRKGRIFKRKTLGLYGNVYSPKRGFLVRQGKEVTVIRAFVNYLLNEFASEWDTIDFRALSLRDRLICEFLEILKAENLVMKKETEFDNVRTFLTEKRSEDFFRSLSKKLRQNIRTGINKLKKSGTVVIWLVKSDDQHVEAAIDDYYSVYGQSWKAPEIDPNFHRVLGKYLSHKRKLRLFILYYKKDGSNSNSCPAIDDISSEIYEGPSRPSGGFVPIAANYFIVSDRQAYYLKTAYHEDYKMLSPGTVLFWFCVRYLIDNDECLFIDHQQGVEEYKLKWGDIFDTRIRFQAANPNSLAGRLEVSIETQAIPLVNKIKSRLKRVLDPFKSNVNLT